MNNYIINITEIANYKISQIKKYILYELKNHIAATNTLNGILEKNYSLTSNPYIGINYNSNIKFIKFKNYLIYYEINENDKIIFIKTIIHKKQNRINLN